MTKWDFLSIWLAERRDELRRTMIGLAIVLVLAVAFVALAAWRKS